MRTIIARSCALLLTALASFGALAPSARAQSQCVPDGLDQGPCCVTANVVLPSFPAMPAQSVRWLCFNNCNVVAQAQWCAVFGTPAPAQFGGAFLCGIYDIPVRIRLCGLAMALWGGTLKATYSRNWQTTTTAGTSLTVWRFLVNGDLTRTNNVPNNLNYRPACYAAYQAVYFSGYIDYALDCSTNQWQIAWNINHECDGVHHVLGSARPAPSSGYHASRSFSFVGPGANFVPSSTNPLISNGPITQQAVRRNDWANAPQICNYEEPAQGVFIQGNDFCMCSAGGTPQYNASTVMVNGVCGTMVNPSPLSPLMQMRLGSWTNPNVFPGIQTLLFDFGYLDYFDACSGTNGPEWFEGSETIGGNFAVDFNGVAIGRQFEDLGSCNKSATSPATLIGAPHVVNYVLNLNMP